MSWINNLDFERAIKEIQSDEKKGKDFCIDPLRFEDLSLQEVRSELVDSIKKGLSENKYKLSDLLSVDVPKSNYVLRPAARPILVDWVVYQSLANYISSKVYKKVPKKSYSFRRFTDKENGVLKYKSVDYWIQFEEDSIKLSRTKKFKFLLTTDITSFFENISLDILEERLKILSTDREYIGAVNYLIRNVLSTWSNVGKVNNFGLPQGPSASGLLADIYLYSLDKKLSEKDIVYTRYMDDFRVFAKDISSLKLSMMSIVLSLRDLKLNVNAKKTEIYELDKKDDLKKVFDPERESLNLVDRAFRSKRKEQIRLVIPYLNNLKNLSANGGNFSDRYLKFFIGRIVDLMRYGLVEKRVVKSLMSEFLIMFEQKHHLTDKLAWFFVAGARYDDTLGKLVKGNLLKFLCDPKKNIYEWQEMWVLDILRQIGGLTKRELKKLKSKYRHKSDLCYAQFCLLVGEEAWFDELEIILQEKRVTQDTYRATGLSLKEMNTDVVNRARITFPNYFNKYLASLSGRMFGFKYSLMKEDLNSNSSDSY